MTRVREKTMGVQRGRTIGFTRFTMNAWLLHVFQCLTADGDAFLMNRGGAHATALPQIVTRHSLVQEVRTTAPRLFSAAGTRKHPAAWLDACWRRKPKQSVEKKLLIGKTEVRPKPSSVLRCYIPLGLSWASKAIFSRRHSSFIILIAYTRHATVQEITVCLLHAACMHVMLCYVMLPPCMRAPKLFS